MYNVSILRTLIENGWTIANRRAIISKIGKANFDEIINLAHSANIADSFQYSNALTYLEPANIQRTKKLLSDIIISYKEYAKCPYINDLLRTGSALSENSQKILNSLKLAILNNRLTGKFVRGISPTRTNKLETIDDVSKFIFDNKGFTSAVPETNENFANCFALGRNGVKVIFDVKNFPGYRANNYEVIFDTNAFTKDKFDIIQEGEKLFRIVEK
ncbi:hypothetical protein IKP85_04585 [bacterium]|nr:hypothetical protein [bacterium]